MMYFIQCGALCVLFLCSVKTCWAGPATPSIGEVQLWAVQVAGLTLSRHDSAWHRMRNAAWAPDTKIGWLSGEDHLSRSQLKVTFDDVDGDGSTTEGTSVDSRIEVSLKWRFEDVVSHPREVSLLRELRHSSAARLVLLERVTRLYFDWVDSKKKLSTESVGDLEYRRIQSRVRRLVGHLDAFTAGRFSKSVKAEVRHGN